MWMRNGVRMEDGEPFLWEVNGAEGVRIQLHRGLEDRYYITDEAGKVPAPEHPWYPTVEAALESIRSRH